jgi:hypothetical protein
MCRGEASMVVWAEIGEDELMRMLVGASFSATS